jgi:hypothetical protein
MAMYHRCLAKIKIIFERTGILIGHDEISLLCELWRCMNAEEFMKKLDSMSNEELVKWLERIKKRRKILETYLTQEQKVYA